MPSPKFEHSVPQMTVEAASEYADKIHALLGSRVGSGDPDELDVAFDRFERQYGVGYWTIEHLRKRKAKTCDVGLFATLKAAYFDLCEKTARRLLHEIELEKATGDETNSDLADRLTSIVAELAQRKARKAQGLTTAKAVAR